MLQVTGLSQDLYYPCMEFDANSRRPDSPFAGEAAVDFSAAGLAPGVGGLGLAFETWVSPPFHSSHREEVL